MFEVGENFICLRGRIYYPQPIKDGLKACQQCDFRHDFGDMDCSCICLLLNCDEHHTLKEVYTDAKIMLNL